MEAQEQEITLGTGRLLGLFFGLVIVCALFFSVGFSLGRRSLPEPVAAATSTASAIVNAEGKPSPTQAASKPDCATPGACPEAAPKSTSDELTFYKAVEQNAPKAKLEPPAPPAAAQVTTRTVESKPVTAEMHRPVTLGAGYMVQVAAVTKQEDAQALVNALRRKSYPVITTSGPNDRFYHVQVGPFSDMKDAEAMRSKLTGDGYNSILKK